MTIEIAFPALDPALANGISRVLQLAAQAAMQGRTDQDLINALDAIQGEVLAAWTTYHNIDEPPKTEDPPY